MRDRRRLFKLNDELRAAPNGPQEDGILSLAFLTTRKTTGRRNIFETDEQKLFHVNFMIILRRSDNRWPENGAIKCGQEIEKQVGSSS